MRNLILPANCARTLSVRLKMGWLVLCLVMSGGTALAQVPDSLSEAQLKAVFIYNFSKFIEWPDTAFRDGSGSFQICVAGNNPFGNALQILTNRTYQGRPIIIRYPQSASDAHGCHILYVEDSASYLAWHELVKTLDNTPVLLVSNGEQSVQSGAAIGFVQRQGKVRWILNLNATRKAQLKVSVKLLEIAAQVVGDVSR